MNNIIDKVTEVFSDFQNEMDNLRNQNENLQKEISELRKLLVAGETLRSQYVLCCAMNVKPEIIAQYVKNYYEILHCDHHVCFKADLKSALNYVKEYLGTDCCGNLVYDVALPPNWQGEKTEYLLYDDSITIEIR